MSNKLINKKTVVFLDRDGVINENNGFVNKEEDFKFIFGSPYAIKSLNDAGVITIIVTNQGGIEKGFLTEDQFLDINNYMRDQLKKFGAKIDHVYYCPYMEGPCRKPEPGMILSAIKDFNLQKYNKYLIGDRLTDIEAGNKTNCTTILVETGDGKKEKEKLKDPNSRKLIKTPNHITDNLKNAVKWILNGEVSY